MLNALYFSAYNDKREEVIELISFFTLLFKKCSIVQFPTVISALFEQTESAANESGVNRIVHALELLMQNKDENNVIYLCNFLVNIFQRSPEDLLEGYATDFYAYLQRVKQDFPSSFLVKKVAQVFSTAEFSESRRSIIFQALRIQKKALPADAAAASAGPLDDLFEVGAVTLPPSYEEALLLPKLEDYSQQNTNRFFAMVATAAEVDDVQDESVLSAA